MNSLLDDARIDVSQTPPVPFGRLAAVEARKMFDTRAGRWLIGITVGLLLAAMVVALLVMVLSDMGASLNGWLQVLTIPLSLLMPTIAIMSITQEWGQRTALTTFALEPRRIRVVAAKLVAVTALALVTMALAVLFGLLGNLLYDLLGSRDASWEIDGVALGWAVFTQLAFFVMAFGLGALLLSTPAAIVIYYVVSLLLPMMVTGAVYSLVSWGPDVIPWFDLTFAVAPFSNPDMPRPDNAVAQLVVATTLWVVLPLALGLRRIQRIELK
jgi:ABC-2 type transport system permease protein